MATTMAAGIAFVRKIQSASNMSLANRNSISIDIEDGRGPSPTVSLQEMESQALKRRIGRRPSLSNIPDDTSGAVEVPNLPATDVNEGQAEQPGNTSRTRTRTWTGLFHRGSNSGSQTEDRVSELEVQKEIQAEYAKCDSRLTNDYPEGIPRLAAVQSSSDDLAIIRLFRYSHTRILLQLELEIAEMEEKIFEFELGFEEDSNNWHLLTSITSKDEENKKYKKLLQDLKLKVKEYGDLALNFARLQALKQPQERNHRSVFNYIMGEKPLITENRKFIYAKDDFVCVKECHENYFDELMQRYFGHWPRSILKVFLETEKEAPLNTDPAAKYYSASRLRDIVKMFSVCIAVGLLLAPVYLLFLVSMSRGLMALTASAFLVLFASIMTFMTDAKLEMIFVGTATYGAVLIMFLGNLNGGGKAFVP